MKTSPSKNRSIKQNSNRLAAYLATGIGAGLAATPAANAAIVTIDITSTGFGIDGVNAGVSPGSFTDKNPFPIFNGGTIRVFNLNGLATKGLMGAGGLSFAAGSSNASPVKFTPYQSIDSLANWNSGGGIFLPILELNPQISDQEATWDSKQTKGTTAGWR
jgi:hypothetical protein